jgi:DNA-binding CsgD family transcriptional regulator
LRAVNQPALPTFAMDNARSPILSARQTEIVKLVPLGKTNREIGQTLHLSTRTVENHVAALFHKFNVGSRTALVAAILQPAHSHRARMRTTKTNLPMGRTRFVGRETRSQRSSRPCERPDS